MLIFVYGTDFHGNTKKFHDIFKFAVDHDIRLIHLGADILPKGSDILGQQKKFIKGFLRDYYKRCQDKGVTILSSFGNDDIYSRKPYFREYGSLLDEHPYTQDGYEFTAYNMVPDYPFGLKSACLLDAPGWKLTEPQLGRPVDVGPNGFEPIQDLDKYFKDKGTVEDDLKHLKGGNRAIVAIHCPPQGFDLDVCYFGRRVGSKSVTEWIAREQPLLCMCGHIHENYEVTGTWKAVSGNTTIIQPGQLDKETSLVHIEINGPSVNARLVTL